MYRDDNKQFDRYTQGNPQQYYRGSRGRYNGYLNSTAGNQGFDFAMEQGILDPVHAEKYNVCRRLRRAVPKIVVGMSIVGLGVYTFLGWPLIAIQSGIILGGSGIYLVGLVGSIWHKMMGRRIQPGNEPNRMFNGSPMRPGLGEGLTFGLGAWHGRGRNRDRNGYQDDRYYDNHQYNEYYGDFEPEYDDYNRDGRYRSRRSNRSRRDEYGYAQSRRRGSRSRYDDYDDYSEYDRSSGYNQRYDSQYSRSGYDQDQRYADSGQNTSQQQSNFNADETNMFQ